MNSNYIYLYTIKKPTIIIEKSFDDILNENIEIIFLGDGEEKENLVSLAKSLKVAKRVHFLGRVKNPYKYMAKSDIFVSCSESEGFPNVLVEAMICGIPVISSDCISGPMEILGDNEYGLLFDVGDKNKLLENIKLLLNNKELKEDLIKKAKKEIRIARIQEGSKKLQLRQQIAEDNLALSAINKEIKQLKDGWTIKTLDGLPSAHFEHTIVVRKGKAEILSSFEEIEKKISG